MIKKVNLVLITAVLVIVLLALEIFIVKSASRYEPEVGIVFSKVKILEGTQVKAEMLQEKRVNLGLVHKQALRSLKDAEGKMARTDIEEGEMLLSGRLAGQDEMERIKVSDPKNRLFTVEFKGDQANGWWLETGQYVDIIYVANEKQLLLPSSQTKEIQDGNPRQKKRETQVDAYIAKDLENPSGSGDIYDADRKRRLKRLRNIRIAALIDDKGKLLKDTGRTGTPKYVSFEVDGSQDEFLAYAKTNGRLELSVIPDP